MIPQVKKDIANEWSTSTGKFVTKYVGVLELMFPSFSRSKGFSVNCGIVIVTKSQKPTFSIILGVETLAQFGTILDFNEKAIQIDGQKIAMRPDAKIGQGIGEVHRTFFVKSEELKVPRQLLSVQLKYLTLATKRQIYLE